MMAQSPPSAADAGEVEFLLRSLLRRLIERGRITSVRASELRDVRQAARLAIDELESGPQTPSSSHGGSADHAPHPPPAPAVAEGWIALDDPPPAPIAAFQPVPAPSSPTPTWPPAPIQPSRQPLPMPAAPPPPPAPTPDGEEADEGDEGDESPGPKGKGASTRGTTACPRCKAKVTYVRRGPPPYAVECMSCGAKGKLNR